MGLRDFFKKGVEKPVEQKTTKPEAPSPLTTPKTNREYVIQPGDTLSKIASKFYGKAGDWKKIYEHNKDTIKNPDLIYPGEKIIIP